MIRFDNSQRTYGLLLILLALSSALGVYLPQGIDLGRQLPASRPVMAAASALASLILYGCLALAGAKLSKKAGFASILDRNISSNKRFVEPFLVGCMLGLFFAGADAVLSSFHPLGPLPHPPFPTSLVASLSAGIGEEIAFRLFFLSLWTWIVSSVALRGRYRNTVFWIGVSLSGLLFTLAHIPSIVLLFELESFSSIPTALWGELILLNGVLSIFCAAYLRSAGLLAAVGIHFWADIVWHVIWGGVNQAVPF